MPKSTTSKPTMTGEYRAELKDLKRNAQKVRKDHEAFNRSVAREQKSLLRQINQANMKLKRLHTSLVRSEANVSRALAKIDRRRGILEGRIES